MQILILNVDNQKSQVVCKFKIVSHLGILNIDKVRFCGKNFRVMLMWLVSLPVTRSDRVNDCLSVPQASSPRTYRIYSVWYAEADLRDNST